MKTKLHNRLLSAILVIVMLLGLCPVVSFADDSFRITQDGNTIEEVAVPKNERITVTAENAPGALQWQIKNPGQELWVDIMGQTAPELTLSYALLGSMLDQAQTASVRCAATTEEEEVYTATLHATVTEETPVEALSSETVSAVMALAPEPLPAPTGDNTTEDEETPVGTGLPDGPTSEEEETPVGTGLPDGPSSEAEPVEEATEEIDEPTEESSEESTEEDLSVEESAEPSEEGETPVGTGLPDGPTDDADDDTTEESSEEPIDEPASEDAGMTSHGPTEEPAEEPTESEPEVTSEDADPAEAVVLSSGTKTAETLAADGDETTDIVSITINYIYMERQTDADGNFITDADGNYLYTPSTEYVWNPYVANIKSGNDFSVEVSNKTVPGYEAKLAETYPGVTWVADTATSSTSVKIELTNVTTDLVYEVFYQEVKVPYAARYFMQNVHNDLYTEDHDLFRTFEGYQGGQPNEKDIFQEVPGFTSLFHQPDTIAADGSTVFEVYYDRNYYLINFNLDGGYGTAPVYARYGSNFTVATPTKPGYTFAGWDLLITDTNNDDILDAGDSVADPLPSTIPTESRTYIALWTTETTTYTTVYWIKNEDGTTTFLGSAIKDATVGANGYEPVTAEDDLDNTYICGGHVHTAACYSIPTHEHTEACAGVSNGNTSLGSANDRNAIYAIDSTPESGYIYTIHLEEHTDTNTYYKLYLNGKWYESGFDASNISGVSLGEGRYDTGSGIWIANKYYANLPFCESKSKLTCTETSHTHTDACKGDTRYLEFIEPDSETYGNVNVEVKGDGSTILNVYYKYKEYTLRFYYAATTGGTDTDDDGVIDKYDTVKIVGGSTDHFANISSSVVAALNNMFVTNSGQCGSVSSKTLPALTDDAEEIGYRTGTTTGTTYTYHYIEFDARYGDNIAETWPCDVFDTVTVSNGSWSGDNAFLAGWTGEYGVKYNQKANKTIKGVYEKLDDWLLYTDASKETKNSDGKYVISYLAFWENGANVGWSVPELYIYNIWIPCLGNEQANAPAGMVTREFDDTWYYRAQTYKTYDNSRIDQQTEPSLAGYENPTKNWGVIFISNATTYDNINYRSAGNDDGKATYNSSSHLITSGSETVTKELTITKELDASNNETGKFLLYDAQNPYSYSPTSYPADINHTIFREAYYINYLYQAKSHALTIYNYNDTLETLESTDFGTPLTEYGTKYSSSNMQENYYPKDLEPNAYYFDGWYTTADCHPETKIEDWDSLTMPDSDLTLYAKWEPVTHTVEFYYNYTDYQNGVQYKNPITTTHGTTMITPDWNFIPDKNDPNHPDHANSEYLFKQWFYIQDGKKVAFEPSTMTVQKDMKLYAEWTSSLTTKYTVYYALSDEHGNIMTDSNGDTIYLAEPTTGYAFEATTKTFTALPKDTLTKIPDEYKDHLLLPHTNSHSILMAADQAQNTFTFKYMAIETAPYTVKYVDSVTNESLINSETNLPYDKTVDDNTKAIVTETFVYIPNYLPDAFHKELVLSANDAENVIIFYYTRYAEEVDPDPGTTPDPETQQSLILITHYTQAVDDTDYTKYSEYTSETIVADVGTDYTAEYIDIPGFDSYADHDETVKWGSLTEDGLELKLYYNRKKYSYTVNYLKYGTTEALQESKVVPDQPYGKIVSEIAPEIPGYELHGYSSDSATDPQTLTISTDPDRNVITFQYTLKQRNIYYHVVCREAGAENFAILSKNKESVKDADTVSAVEAYPMPGFRFVGWYSDEDCETKVHEEYTYNPVEENDINLSEEIYEYNFYALFEPISLTISQTNMADGDSAVYRITNTGGTYTLDLILTGAESNTIVQIPADTSTIQEVTGNWTWTYENTASQTVEVDLNTDKTVTFDYSAKTVDWLHDEAHG